MARNRDAKCRQCRREGAKLFLKGDRCMTDKCAFERRGYVPGEHGRDRRMRGTDYGAQLREKQKARRIYGILEQQFKNYFLKAERRKGVTGETLLQMLECRLDNVVFRLGFAPSRTSARQLVRHGHFMVNNRKVNVPSFEVRPGNEISVKEKSRTVKVIKESVEASQGREMPGWLEVTRENFTGRLLEVPTRENIPVPIQEQLIVGLYSK
ncbi:MAG: 30S ribosomal protein S4 [Candidatus Eisenbacteria bacterium]|nr:30S ribosomal protein S4 [Candidatus Eisenbacteria bacterium]